MPSGATSLTVSTVNGTGLDKHFHVKFAQYPTRTDYDCRTFFSNETCFIFNPGGGNWIIGVYGWDVGTYTLTATYTTISSVTVTWTSGSPPNPMISGQKYSSAWTVSGGSSVSHTNIHWDADPVRVKTSSAFGSTFNECSTRLLPISLRDR